MAAEHHRPVSNPVDGGSSRPSGWPYRLGRGVAVAMVLAICLAVVVVLSDRTRPPAAPAVQLSLPAAPASPPRELQAGPSSPAEPGPLVLLPLPQPAPAQPASPAAEPPALAALPPAIDPQPAARPQAETPPAMAPNDTARSLTPEGLPAWRRNAVAVADIAGRPKIAVVIDDMGLDQRRSGEVATLPGPLTLSYLPYSRDLARQTAAAHAHGHELLVHVPMQPLDDAIKTGPNALTIDLPAEEIRRRLDGALASFEGYVGINNHMGSRFTADRDGMAVVMEELRARGLLFLDSRTGQHSVADSLAAVQGVPHADRHIFLDNELTVEAVNRQLAETERLARRNGFAVAIGHPHDVTIAALRSWLPLAGEKGLALVPISAIVAALEARRTAGQQSAAP